MSSSGDPRSADAESMPVIARSTPNHRSVVVQVNQTAEQEGESTQEPKSFTEAPIRCFNPENLSIILDGIVKAIVRVAFVVVGFIDYLHTNNLIVFLLLAGLANGSIDFLQLINFFINKSELSKKKSDDM